MMMASHANSTRRTSAPQPNGTSLVILMRFSDHESKKLPSQDGIIEFRQYHSNFCRLHSFCAAGLEVEYASQIACSYEHSRHQ